jgi:hypothetical protein
MPALSHFEAIYGMPNNDAQNADYHQRRVIRGGQ